MEHKQYLGDGVYIDFDGCHVMLSTDRNTVIYLDHYVLDALTRYVKQLGEEASSMASNMGKNSPTADPDDPIEKQRIKDREMGEAIAKTYGGDE